jgi:hypothetical protein
MSNTPDFLPEALSDSATKDASVEAAPAPSAQVPVEPVAATQADLLCHSRLAADIMDKHKDEWILVVAIAISEAQALITQGEAYKSALAHADHLIEQFERVSHAIFQCFDELDPRQRETIRDLRISAAVSIAAGGNINEIIERIRQLAISYQPAAGTATP